MNKPSDVKDKMILKGTHRAYVVSIRFVKLNYLSMSLRFRILWQLYHSRQRKSSNLSPSSQFHRTTAPLQKMLDVSSPIIGRGTSLLALQSKIESKATTRGDITY